MDSRDHLHLSAWRLVSLKALISTFMFCCGPARAFWLGACPGIPGTEGTGGALALLKSGNCVIRVEYRRLTRSEVFPPICGRCLLGPDCFSGTPFGRLDGCSVEGGALSGFEICFGALMTGALLVDFFWRKEKPLPLSSMANYLLLSIDTGILRLPRCTRIAGNLPWAV